MKTSSGTKNNVVSLADFKKKKEVKEDENFKQAFRDSLDNKQVLERYKIKEPTLQEREEKIKASIARIDKLLKDLHKCST